MANYATVELWVRVSEAGDFDCGPTAEAAGERFEESIGHDNETGYRMVRVKVRVPLPEPIEVTGEAADDEAADPQAA